MTNCEKPPRTRLTLSTWLGLAGLLMPVVLLAGGNWFTGQMRLTRLEIHDEAQDRQLADHETRIREEERKPMRRASIEPANFGAIP